MQDVNAAEFKSSGKATQAANMKAQVLLDRAGFSPGAIDGRASDNFENALRAFQKKNALGETGKLDKETWEKLAQSAEPALIEYTITEKDVKGPFADEIPAKYEDKAKLKRLDYTGAAEMLAERFHMDEKFLEELNRGKDFDKAGTVIAVANINVKPVALPKQAGSKAAKIEADKGNNVVRVLAKDGALIASYPASIGSDDKPAPSGTLKVVRIAQGPDLHLRPGIQVQRREGGRQAAHRGGAEQSGRLGMDRARPENLWHPRHVRAVEGRQGRLAWLRAHDQLGCAGARGDGAEGDGGGVHRLGSAVIPEAAKRLSGTHLSARAHGGMDPGSRHSASQTRVNALMARPG